MNTNTGHQEGSRDQAARILAVKAGGSTFSALAAAAFPDRGGRGFFPPFPPSPFDLSALMEFYYRA